MTCIELCVTGQKLSTTLKSKGFGYSGFQIEFKTHPPKPAEVEPSFIKASLPPAKLRMLFPAHLWVREFGHKSTPSHRPWIEAYCPKF